MYLHYLIPPLPVQMYLSSTRMSAALQHRPSSPVDGPRTPNSDGFEDQADPTVWKRRYLALQETVNDQTSSKRKSG